MAQNVLAAVAGHRATEEESAGIYRTPAEGAAGICIQSTV